MTRNYLILSIIDGINFSQSERETRTNLQAVLNGLRYMFQPQSILLAMLIDNDQIELHFCFYQTGKHDEHQINAVTSLLNQNRLLKVPIKKISTFLYNRLLINGTIIILSYYIFCLKS
ncbi:hypothetical protein BpHYR1_030564 [Brachionus plicatilis]|uniref:Uncharacterized protein n=1 Tax=Brachionus plicatilis TaxID=10195 RepID=A0A3M7SR35_BRAPC|nr:hypothetical protein BpHYR1_030564 [Brachionus plicatilis]